MAATVTISRRNRSIAFTLTLPAAAICAGAAGMLSVRHHAPGGAPAEFAVPVVTLVQPRAGAFVLQERPVVMFRFAVEHRDDPIDAASFRVTLDGDDRTDGFQISIAEAWGSLAGRNGAGPVAAGSHTIEARICTVRGLCGTATDAIVVRPLRSDSPAPSARRGSPAAARRSSR